VPEPLLVVGVVSLFCSCSCAVVAMKHQWDLTRFRHFDCPLKQAYSHVLEEPIPTHFTALLESLDGDDR
jgi:hypothetical protein